MESVTEMSNTEINNTCLETNHNEFTERFWTIWGRGNGKEE
jgi:hypothetical protein